MSVLSDRLRELRGATSQAEMARELDIQRTQWIKYETGASAPGSEILAKICRVHACSADWLLGLDRAPSSLTVNGSGNAIGPGAKAVAITGAVAQVPGESAGCKRCPYKAAVKKLQKAGLKIPGLGG